MASIGSEFQRALRGVLGTGGIRATGVSAGILRTRHVSGRAELYGIEVRPDFTNAPTTNAFWSLDDSNVSASGSAGPSIIGSFIYPSTAGVTAGNYQAWFIRPVPFDNGITMNYTATGTGLGIQYTLFYSPVKDPSLPG